MEVKFPLWMDHKGKSGLFIKYVCNQNKISPKNQE